MKPVSMGVGGFLMAVLWFDLMFDVQVLGQPTGVLDESILASITGYYERVLIGAAPMGHLVGTLMGIGWLSVGFQLKRGELAGVLGWATAALLVIPTSLAFARVIPNAIQLAGRTDALGIQSDLARLICFDHLFCLGSIALFVGLQMVQAHAHGPASSSSS